MGNSSAKTAENNDLADVTALLHGLRRHLAKQLSPKFTIRLDNNTPRHRGDIPNMIVTQNRPKTHPHVIVKSILSVTITHQGRIIELHTQLKKLKEWTIADPHFNPDEIAHRIREFYNPCQESE